MSTHTTRFLALFTAGIVILASQQAGGDTMTVNRNSIYEPITPISEQPIHPVPEAAIPPVHGDKPKMPGERSTPVYRPSNQIQTTAKNRVFSHFDTMDRNGDRKLDWNELQSQQIGIEQDAFQRLDTDESGDLDPGEFISFNPTPQN